MIVDKSETLDLFQDLKSQLNSILLRPCISNLLISTVVRWRVGGPAALFIEPSTVEELIASINLIREARVPFFILGEGSNVLFDSSGFCGVLIRIGSCLSDLSFDDNEVRAQAGLWVPRLAQLVGRKGLSGLEHIVGIPGTIGGLVSMNGGSQRKYIGTNVSYVKCLDNEGAFFKLSKADCEFGYRSSLIQKRKLIVVEVGLNLEFKESTVILKEMREILRSRRLKFPRKLPNCGSTFLSSPELYSTLGPPGKVIEELGLKGVSIGDAQISPLHANFIVNRAAATSSDILHLISRVRTEGYRKYLVKLDCEVIYISPAGEMMPAHEKADALFG